MLDVLNIIVGILAIGLGYHRAVTGNLIWGTVLGVLGGINLLLGFNLIGF